jgi:hypothetical protein
LPSRVQQAGAPQAVVLPQRQDLLRHFLVLLFEAGAGRMAGRQGLQHAHQATHAPAVAASPEHLPAFGFALLEGVGVAVVQVFFLVVQVVRGGPPFADGEVQVALFAGDNSSVPVRRWARMSSKLARMGAIILSWRRRWYSSA